MMSIEWEKLYKLGTDVAAFMFFDPELLQHRLEDDHDWWSINPEQEFLEGTLAAFHTGSDGQFTMKFIQRPLSPLEKKVLVSQSSFRFVVRNERFYWGNSDSLPSDDQLYDANDDENGWISIPNGNYYLTVYALDWFSIPESERKKAVDISHYLVGLHDVSAWNDSPIRNEIPWLSPSKK